jgi:hypothetical protein
VLRGIFIALGAAVLANFSWAFLLFGAAWSDAPGRERVAVARARVAGLGLFARRLVGGSRWLGRAAPHQAAPPRYTPPRVHTNACGDFTLLAREDWFALRGYSELDIFSLHLDSLFLYAAHAGGYREVTLDPPMRAYHIEHSAGSGWTPEGETALFERLRKKGIPALGTDELFEHARAMLERNDPLLFSNPDWGLVHDDLPETRIGAGGIKRGAA